jgi:superfamily I DNA/RNA helicase
LHFHGWCGQLLKRHQVKVAEGQAQYFERQVSSTIAAVEAGAIDPHQYAAILIDEAHDFEADWFKIVVPLLDPESDSLLVLYDDAQSIYKKKKTLDFTFSSVGIQARGRTTVLRTNYRNTLEILMVAKYFAHSIFTETAEQQEDLIPTLSPDSAGRRGDVPELQCFATAEDEANYIVERIAQQIKQGVRADKIAILYRHKRQTESLEKALTGLGIAFVSTSKESNKMQLYSDEPSVKVVSMPSSKGLEFDSVFIPHLNEMPNKKSSLENEARLLYVAMTRAIETLVFTYHESSEFTEQVQQAIAQTEKY